MMTTWKIIALEALTALACFGAGWQVNGWRMGARVAECQAQSAARDAQADKQALEKFGQATQALNTAAQAAQSATTQINTANSDARQRWQELVKREPLPEHCKPGPARAEAMREAIVRTREHMK